MKKRIVAVLILGVMLALAGAAPAEDIAVDLEIREKLFMAQINDIYLNFPEYAGKTVKLEGFVVSTYFEPSDSIYTMVFRFGPGCCGDDEIIGMEVAWADDGIAFPENNTWVEAIGIVEEYEDLGKTYVRLNLLSLTPLETRGAERIYQ